MAQTPKGDIVGRKIVGARKMTKDEAAADGWNGLRDWDYPIVLILDDGTLLYASADEEGNGPGELFGTACGITFMITPAQEDDADQEVQGE